jgi:hypothetical protein
MKIRLTTFLCLNAHPQTQKPIVAALACEKGSGTASSTSQHAPYTGKYSLVSLLNKQHLWFSLMNDILHEFILKSEEDNFRWNT